MHAVPIWGGNGTMHELSAHGSAHAWRPCALCTHGPPAQVMTDPATGASKGYGFVRFSDMGERDRAVREHVGGQGGGDCDSSGACHLGLMGASHVRCRAHCLRRSA
jgi:hypothetical protein